MTTLQIDISSSTPDNFYSLKSPKTKILLIIQTVDNFRTYFSFLTRFFEHEIFVRIFGGICPYTGRIFKPPESMLKRSVFVPRI